MMEGIGGNVHFDWWGSGWWDVGVVDASVEKGVLFDFESRVFERFIKHNILQSRKFFHINISFDPMCK